jgi:hypothetical protein
VLDGDEPCRVRAAATSAAEMRVFGITTAPRARRPAADLACNLGDGANVGQRVQRHGDVEVIFQLAYEFQDLKRVETEVGE